jgi:hypothetical protein
VSPGEWNQWFPGANDNKIAGSPANNGAGRVVANSAVVLGGLNTVGFFADPNGNFRSSSVAIGPCDATITTPCTGLYVAFERSKKIERINFVDQPPSAQSIETISKTNDVRKGVRYGIADFHNADGTDDLYIDELGGAADPRGRPEDELVPLPELVSQATDSAPVARGTPLDQPRRNANATSRRHDRDT